ncbi:MAG: isoaspartyl peptidase/L-asparaginase family protein [Nitrospirota bacterium]
MLIAVHGGAGNRKPTRKALEKISDSLTEGYSKLSGGGTALDAVVSSIKLLEDSGIFNAGSGANIQLDGIRRLDSSIMEGEFLSAGSVIGIEGIRNPIEAARAVMECPHVMMTDIGARKIAEAHKLLPLPGPDRASLDRLKRLLKEEKIISSMYKKYFSTVGAVAIDIKGNIAAGASTGGITAMLPGRVGDTPIIGAGVYAENPLGAVSCTGIGEFIIRLSLAKEIVMNLKRLSPSKAADHSLKRIIGLDGHAGVIVLNSKGRLAITHTTRYMASGYADKKGIVVKEKFNRLQIK